MCIFVLGSFVALALRKMKLDRQHKESIILQYQQSTIKEISERSDKFKKAIKELKNECIVARLSEVVLKIEIDFEAFITKTQGEVLQCQDEIQQLNHKHKFEFAMKDFQIKIKECARKIQEKQNILKTMKKRYNDIDIKYKMILDAIPTPSDKSFMDIEDLNVKVENFKQNAALAFKSKWTFKLNFFQGFYKEIFLINIFFF